MKDQVISLFYSIGNISIIRKMVKPFQGKAAILLYHRVLPEIVASNNSYSYSITTDMFSEHMRYISENFTPISLDELQHHINHSRDKQLPVVITFDDGYKDTLEYAYPILKKYDIPATIYITTGFPERDVEIWWYELDEICRMKNYIGFELDGKRLEWNLGSAIDRLRCVNEIGDILMTKDYSEQKRIMELARGTISPIDLNEHCLGWDEVKELDKDPLVTIGAHTHTHPVLSNLSEQDAFDEILHSKKLLEEKLCHSIDHFAYPFGEKEHAGAREYEAVKEIGFKTALSTVCTPLNDNTNIFSLPRHVVTNCHDIGRLRVKLSGLNALIGKQA